MAKTVLEIQTIKALIVYFKKTKETLINTRRASNNID